MTDRGQLLLAGAFVLAVTLIGLTLVFSASDYTAVLADEESGITQGTDAIGARESVRADLGSGLRAVHDEWDAYGDYTTKFENLLPRLGTETRDYYARHGRLVNVSNPTFVSGERVKQTDSVQFQKPDIRGNIPTSYHWTVASGTTVRNATFVFDHLTGPSTRFTVVFGSDWAMEVYEGSSGSDWKVTVVDRSSSYDATCTRSGTGSPMTVDVSEATVDGDHCHALTAIDPGTTYDLEIENGGDASGKFWLIVDGMAETHAGASPHNEVEDVIYDVTVDYRYQSSAVNYETEITAAPGEIE